LALLDGEQHAGDATTGEVGANLKEAVAHRPTDGHTDRPTKLDSPDIVAESLAVFCAQAPQPIADGLSSGRRLVKRGGQSLHLDDVPKMVQKGKA
jgi:hypothetical protein